MCFHVGTQCCAHVYCVGNFVINILGALYAFVAANNNGSYFIRRALCNTRIHVYNNNNCLYVYWYIILVRVRTCDYVIVLKIIISVVPRDEVKPPPPPASSWFASSLLYMTIEHVYYNCGQ